MEALEGRQKNFRYQEVGGGLDDPPPAKNSRLFSDKM